MGAVEKEEAKNVYDLLFEDKVMHVVKEKCKIKEVVVPFDEFLHRAQHMQGRAEERRVGKECRL